MEYIRSNEISELKQIIKLGYTLDFKIEYEAIELDLRVTPLVVASFLGRTEAVSLMIDSKMANVDLTTETTCKLYNDCRLHASNDCLS